MNRFQAKALHSLTIAALIALGAAAQAIGGPARATGTTAGGNECDHDERI